MAFPAHAFVHIASCILFCNSLPSPCLPLSFVNSPTYTAIENIATAGSIIGAGMTAPMAAVGQLISKGATQQAAQQNAETARSQRADSGGIAPSSGKPNQTLLTGDEWNKYFQSIYGKENVAWKYGTSIEGSVVTGPQQDLGALSSTFTGGAYRTVVTTEDITAYRAFGGAADAGGGFATTSPSVSTAQTRVDSAILPGWNSLQYEAKITIPQGTTLNIGTVAPQMLPDGTLYPGGADQILLPQNWDLNWITGIRILE